MEEINFSELWSECAAAPAPGSPPVSSLTPSCPDYQTIRSLTPDSFALNLNIALKDQILMLYKVSTSSLVLG